MAAPTRAIWLVAMYCISLANSEHVMLEVDVSQQAILEKEASGSTLYCEETVSISMVVGGELVTLTLSRMEEFDNVSMVALGEGYTQQLSPEDIAGGCFYQDGANMAALSADIGKHFMAWRGIFHTSQGAHSLEPDESRTVTRRATANTNKVTSRHVVNQLNDIGLAALEAENTQRKKRSSLHQNYVSVKVFVDYSMFTTFYNRASGNTADRTASTREEIKYYVTHIYNDVSLIYNHIQRFNLHVILSEIAIAEHASVSPTEEIKIDTETTLHQPITVISDSRIIELMEDRSQSLLQSYDHVMLFTNYDLYYVEGNSLSTTGIALTGGMCTSNSVSCVENNGVRTTAVVAAHELAHSLSANHDGDGNSCNPSQHHIMSPIIEYVEDMSTFPHVFTFSSCSISEIDGHLDKFRRAGSNSFDFGTGEVYRTCFEDRPSVYNTQESQRYLAEMPGQRYDLHQQCMHAELQGAADTYYCAAIPPLDENDFCKYLNCYMSTGNSCTVDADVEVAYVAQGTTCGDKKWCIDGECVYDNRAPTKKDNCFAGNYRGPFQNAEDANFVSNCDSHISTQPWLCYQQYDYIYCCGSCQMHVNTNLPEGCLYGNKQENCTEVDQSRASCYELEDVCCESCHIARGDRPWNCKYGDILSSCDIARCNDTTYQLQCCDTCYEFLPTTPAPTTPSASGTLALAYSPLSLLYCVVYIVVSIVCLGKFEHIA